MFAANMETMFALSLIMNCHKMKDQ